MSNQPLSSDAPRPAASRLGFKPTLSGCARFAQDRAIQLILIALVAVFVAVSEDFRSVSVFQNILLQSATSGCLAAGMTILVISGTFDLSVAGILAFSGIVLAHLTNAGQPAVGILLAILTGTVIGAFNGTLVATTRINPLIATLGLMWAYLGLSFLPSGPRERVVIGDPWLSSSIGHEKLLGFPVPFLVMVLVYVLAYCYIRFVGYGRYTKAVGANVVAARIAGIRVNRVRILAFTLTGLCCGIGGVLATSQFSMASPYIATGAELNAVAVVVLGGTSLAGGRGSLFGSATAAVILAMINSGLNLARVDPFWQYAVVGGIILVAAGLQGIRRAEPGTER